MSRHFTRASSDSITLASGAMSGCVGGPSTFVALWRASSASRGTIADARTAADYVVGSWRCETGGRMWYAYDGAYNYTECQPYTPNTWRIDAWTKGAGNSMVRAHYASIGSAWTHTDYSPKTDSATAISKIVVGNGSLLGGLNGDVAAAALIGRVLSDAEIETFWGGLLNWYMAIGATNAALWAFNQPNVSIPVVDVTGDGANQLSISGTSIETDPPGFSYSIMDCQIAASFPRLGCAIDEASRSAATAQINPPAPGTSLYVTADATPSPIIGTTPCGWEITTCGCGPGWDTYTPEVRETASAMAIGVMWMATARRYGLCDVVVQPCAKPALLREYQTYPVSNPDYGWAYTHQGQWYNGCAGQDENTGCCSGCELDLEGPTTTAGITEVTIDGVVLPPTSYKVMNGHILVRTDGACWPTCANYSTQNPPALQVEYKKGRAIPTHVQKATERLACEWAKACTGNACALPRKLRTLTRQGVEAVVEELSTTKPGRIRTGIPEVDMVIALENPHGRTMASIVWSPDELPPRVLS